MRMNDRTVLVSLSNVGISWNARATLTRAQPVKIATYVYAYLHHLHTGSPYKRPYYPVFTRILYPMEYLVKVNPNM